LKQILASVTCHVLVYDLPFHVVAIHFYEPIGNIISSNLDDMTKNLKDESMKTGSSTLNVVTMTNNSYGRPLVQDKPNNNSIIGS
jgi:hypothetical protein